MTTITCYFTVLSPWAYLAGQRLEEIAARHQATIDYRPVDISTVFQRTGGKVLADRHESRKEYRLQELRRQSAKRQMPLNPRPAFWPVNPAPASYAIIAAQKAGGGDLGGLVHGVMRATWAEDRDISDDAVLRDLLAAHGFDPALTDRGLLSGAEAYARNTEDAVAAGAFGSPFYIVGDERFWGQDRLEDLDLFLSGKL